MESELTKSIDNNTNEYFVMVRTLVDHYIVELSLNYGYTERNQIILEVFKRLEKNYLANPNTKFETNRKEVIDVLVKSYIAKFIKNIQKDL
jgi:hypothetical protein